METEPGKEHQWLHKLVGEWNFEVEATMDAGCSPEHFKGSERVRSIGGLWVVADGEGEMPGGGTATTMMTLGYDPRKNRYLGTWIGSMMNHLWLYDGALDAAEKVLTLDSEGPSMTGTGQMAKFRDVIEFLSDDHRMLSSHMLNESGEWRQIMTAHYRRKG